MSLVLVLASRVQRLGLVLEGPGLGLEGPGLGLVLWILALSTTLLTKHIVSESFESLIG